MFTFFVCRDYSGGSASLDIFFYPQQFHHTGVVESEKLSRSTNLINYNDIPIIKLSSTFAF